MWWRLCGVPPCSRCRRTLACGAGSPSVPGRRRRAADPGARRRARHRRLAHGSPQSRVKFPKGVAGASTLWRSISSVPAADRDRVEHPAESIRSFNPPQPDSLALDGLADRECCCAGAHSGDSGYGVARQARSDPYLLDRTVLAKTRQRGRGPAADHPRDVRQATPGTSCRTSLGGMVCTMSLNVPCAPGSVSSTSRWGHPNRPCRNAFQARDTRRRPGSRSRIRPLE